MFYTPEDGPSALIAGAVEKAAPLTQRIPRWLFRRRLQAMNHIEGERDEAFNQTVHLPAEKQEQLAQVRREMRVAAEKKQYRKFRRLLRKQCDVVEPGLLNAWLGNYPVPEEQNYTLAPTASGEKQSETWAKAKFGAQLFAEFAFRRHRRAFNEAERRGASVVETRFRNDRIAPPHKRNRTLKEPPNLADTTHAGAAVDATPTGQILLV